jgi:hypothetical protein
MQRRRRLLAHRRELRLSAACARHDSRRQLEVGVGQRYRWREHEGRGFWRGDAWEEF